MIDVLKEYFRFTENRPADGFLSWQHLLYVTLMVGIATALGIYLGKKHRGNEAASRKTFRITAAVMLGCELFKIVLISFRSHNPAAVRGCLPLFLCSVNLFTIPLAGFAHGKLRRFAIDFIFIYGILCCLAGTYLATNYFDNGPVLSFDPMNSVTTHCIAGFAAVYISAARLQSKGLKNGPMALLLLVGVEGLALLANFWNKDSNGVYESNYMFLSESAGTPFEIVNTIVGGNRVLYTLGIALLYLLFGFLFILIYRLADKGISKKKAVAAQ